MNPIFQPLIDELAKLSTVAATAVTALKAGTLTQEDKDAIAKATSDLAAVVAELTAATTPV